MWSTSNGANIYRINRTNSDGSQNKKNFPFQWLWSGRLDRGEAGERHQQRAVAGRIDLVQLPVAARADDAYSYLLVWQLTLSFG